MRRRRKQKNILRACGLGAARRENCPRLSDDRISGGDTESKVPVPSAESGTFTIYGEDWCGWTSKARQLLKVRNIPFVYHVLGDARRSFASKNANNWRTIPLVFYEGRFLGGYEALEKALEK